MKIRSLLKTQIFPFQAKKSLKSGAKKRTVTTSGSGAQQKIPWGVSEKKPPGPSKQGETRPKGLESQVSRVPQRNVALAIPQKKKKSLAAAEIKKGNQENAREENKLRIFGPKRFRRNGKQDRGRIQEESGRDSKDPCWPHAGGGRKGEPKGKNYLEWEEEEKGNRAW